MRVLILSNWYPTDDSPSLGIFVHEHAKAMAAAGIDVQVLHFYTRPSDELFRKEVYRDIRDGITVYHVIVHSRFHKAILLRKGYFESQLTSVMDDILDEFDPDLLHAHVVFQAGILARRLSRTFEIPYVITEHWSGLGWFSNTWYMPVGAARRAYRDAEGVSAVSPFLAGQMRRHMGVTRDIEVIPNVVDTGLFHPACGANSTESGAGKTSPEDDEDVSGTVISAAGNFKPSGKKASSKKKGSVSGNPVRLLCVNSLGIELKVTQRPELLPEALSLMTESERQKYHITIVGSWEGLNEFNDKVRMLGLQDQVHTTGFVPRDQIAELMRNSDALVHPTEIETFDIVVAEALCSGLICVVSAKGALPDLIYPGRNGLLVPKNTAKDWLNALMLVPTLTESADPLKISAEMSCRFSYEVVGKSWHEWLLNFI